jgi:hypothetical protein
MRVKASGITAIEENVPDDGTSLVRIALAGLLLILAIPAAAGPDALGCFTRSYERAHLARHPDQLVTAVKLHIYRPP